MEDQVPVKTAKPARKRTSSSPTTKVAAQRKVEYADIAERAYFIHIDEGCNDPLANWLRAERELTAA
jgi:hypothetical protein